MSSSDHLLQQAKGWRKARRDSGIPGKLSLLGLLLEGDKQERKSFRDS